jgi:hypothetical protein
MEDKFYNDEFEQFLQQQANNHRMYPTDGVWQGIYKKLHGDKKWPGLTIAAFTFLTAIIAISVYFVPKPNIFELEPSKTAATPSPYAKQSKAFNTPLITSVSNSEKHTQPQNYVAQQDASQPVDIVADVSPIIADPNNAELEKTTVPEKLLASLSTSERKLSSVGVSAIKDERSGFIANINAAKPVDNFSNDAPSTDINSSSARGDVQSPAKEKISSPSVNTPGTSKLEKDRDDKNIADDFLKQHKNDLSLFTTTRKQSQKKKFSYTVYITPSMSFRKLKEDDLFKHKSSNVNGPVALNYVTDVNKVVRHTPGTGIETGVGFAYHLTNTLAITTGFQFNIRQYNIEAYKSSGELATIELLSRSGNVDSVSSIAIYRNNNGYRAAELVNRYYQVSMPVGLQWEVIGNNKVKFNIAANVQPTYTINRKSYVLTTDYKNYTANEAMLRSWNVNSNIEAFMSVKVGEYRWQLGPQFRYQHLPTFITEYPIREHLVDYGFKVGVSKIIK